MVADLDAPKKLHDDVSPWAGGRANKAASPVTPALGTPDRPVVEPRRLNEEEDAWRDDDGEPRSLPRNDGTVQLVWSDPAVMPQLRRRWTDLLERLEDHPADLELDTHAPSESAKDVEQHREVFQVLVSGDLAIVQELERIAAASVRKDGKLVPPLVLVEGEVQLALDGVAKLETAAAIAGALCSPEGALRPKLDAITNILSGGALDSQMTVVDELYRNLCSEFAKELRSLQSGYLEQQVEAVLHGRRAYARRPLFGAEQLRAHLLPVGGRIGAPLYLPAECAAALPLFASFPGRVLAEVHPRCDQAESHPIALRARALGHMVSLRRG